MSCGSCGRENAANRRYCGGCGHDIVIACHMCGFGNQREDRFCGGCRAEMDGHVQVVAPRLGTAPVVAVTAPIDELAGLFGNAHVAPTPINPLPDTNIGQDDLDRLFGVK